MSAPSPEPGAGPRPPSAAPAGPSDEALSFLAEYTGLTLPECRARALAVRDSAVSQNLHVYRCVAELMFLTARVARHPKYSDAMAALDADPAARWLEVGCAFGADVRKLVLDGWPAAQVHCLDVTRGYWDLGLRLFGDAGTLACPTAFGNILEDAFFPPSPPPGFADPLPRRAFAVVSVAAVLHVLAKEDVEGLLSRIFEHLMAPGGLLLGSCVGTAVEDGQSWWETPDGTGRPRFLHSGASLRRLLEKVGYVDVEVGQHVRPDRAMLRSEGPREVQPGTREAEALANDNLRYLVFSARKP
ncbi:hypothetical protein DFJ74DRAFT_702140 [Hyaloraphidium curvatum]|nr:hypothetical protein DFJ74DRAFT_702140 [Hyaloraphidium curvatum]